MAMFVALLFSAAIAALAHEPRLPAVRQLGGTIARRIACAPRLPEPCKRNPLVEAYGTPLAKLVRFMASIPAAAVNSGPDSVPVDFRRCRRPSCATGGPDGARLTTAFRRRTLFVSISDRRRAGAGVEITYWAYRPGMGWSRLVRHGDRAAVAAAGGLRLSRLDDPVLVPLETLPGRDHYEFPAAEEPPWRWQLKSRYPG
jgi:hypothetical protein